MFIELNIEKKKTVKSIKITQNSACVAESAFNGACVWLSQHLAGIVDEPDYAHVISFSTRALLSLGESIEVFVCYFFCTFYFLLFSLSPLLEDPRETT